MSKPNFLSRALVAIAPLLVVGGAATAAEETVAAWKELRRIPVPAEYPRVGSVKLSPDGARVAFVATWQEEQKGDTAITWTKKSVLFVDGERVTEELYGVNSPTFSPDGARVGYLTVTPVDNSVSTASWQARVDKQVLAGIGITSPPLFSPDGKRMAWLADVSPSAFKPRTALYVDGKVVSEEVERPLTWSMTDQFEMDSEPIVAFSADGSKLAFNAKLGKKHALVVNGTDVAPEAKVIGPPKFSPDGRLYFQAKVKGGWCLMADGQKASELFDQIGKPVFSADGRTVAFRASPKDSWAVYVDGRKVSPELEKIGPIALSADGRNVAYPVRVAGRWTVYMNDRKLAVDFPAPKLGSDGLRGLVLNADGTRVAYAYETFQELELNYYGVPETSVVMVNETRVAPDFTASDFLVVGGTTLVFAGHDPRSHEIVVGSLPF